MMLAWMATHASKKDVYFCMGVERWQGCEATCEATVAPAIRMNPTVGVLAVLLETRRPLDSPGFRPKPLLPRSLDPACAVFVVVVVAKAVVLSGRPG